MRATAFPTVSHARLIDDGLNAGMRWGTMSFDKATARVPSGG